MPLFTTRARARHPRAHGTRLATVLLLGLAATAVAAPAGGAERTYHDLTTGNGLGFQIYSTEQNKITQFLEHPYRYLRPRPGEPMADGIARRNLAFDVYFGVRGGSDHGWLNEPSSAGEAGYLEQTHIIKAPVTLGGIEAESYFFAPFGAEDLGNVMIGVLKAPAASDGYVLFNFHMGNGEGDTVGANGESVAAIAGGDALSETGPGGGAMVYVPLSGVAHADCQGAFDKVKSGQDLGDNPSCSGDDIALGLQAQLTDGWMAVAVAFVENASDASSRADAITAWAAGRAPEQILNDAVAEFEAWRKPPPAELALCSDNEKLLWRQSEAVLRMGQTREPYTSTRKNHGMMLASLPRGMWHSGWVRDAAYGLVAFARTGHHEEARMGLDFFLNAGPVGKYPEYVSDQDYRISVVRYFGNGEEEADYSGQPTPNVEIDGWGMTLWVARQYVAASSDTAWLSSKTQAGETVYDVLKSGIADPLEANLESTGIAKADSGIWEVHDANKRHFAYTTMATIRGFCDMAALAKAAGRDEDVTKYQGLTAKAKEGFLSSFVDTNGALAGSLEGLQIQKYYDGAVAEAFTWNILDDFTGDTANATLEVLNNLRVESGGWKRNNDGLSSYDNNEWILVDFRILDALRRNGRGDEADPYLATIIEKAAANFFLLPELYNAVAADGAIGKYWGEVPMVGYGAGAYMMTMFDRSGLIEPNDCGDDMGKTLETLSCEGVDTTPGTSTGGPGGPGGAEGPASFDDIPYGQSACICALPGRTSPRPAGALALLLALPSLLLWRRRPRRA